MSDLFSPKQQVILAITPIVSGLLSVTGSFTIIRLIFLERQTKQIRGNNSKGKESKVTYERIMIGLSISCMLNGLRAATTTFLMPSDTPGVWKAYGNTATCSLQGFFAQLGFSSALYSASLAIYFVLSIHPDIREEAVKTYYEPFLHAIPIVFALVTATAGVFLESFNPVTLGVGCWVAAYPAGCEKDDSTIECTRGENAKLIMWIFGGFVIIISYIIIIISMARIYYLVRNQLRKMEMRYSTGSLGSIGTTSRKRSNGTSNRLRKISTQAFLYIGAFFLTYIWPSLNRIFESEGNIKRYFIMSLCSQIFYPLQGFLNLFIYIRPRLSDLTKQYPDFTRWERVVVVFHFNTPENLKLNKKTSGEKSQKVSSDTLDVLDKTTCPMETKCTLNEIDAIVGDNYLDEQSLEITDLPISKHDELDGAKEFT